MVDQDTVTFSEAMSQTLKTSAVVNIVGVVVLEQLLDNYKLKGTNKYIAIGGVLFLSNSVQYYLEHNGY